MNRYRFKVWEWDGQAFNVLIPAENHMQALFYLIILYPDAPAIDDGTLIEGQEPVSWRRKIINFLWRKKHEAGNQ